MMTLEFAVAAALFAGVLCYAVFGGADFGSGFHDLTAGGSRRGAEVRTLIDQSIGPVWEANHVWLIYVLVMWWTGFPESFAAAMTTLYVPLLLALVGIVLRGASFAFRKYSETLAQARLFGVVFATSSVLAPFFLGTIAGSLASGRVPAGGYGDAWSSWIAPTPLLTGAISVGTCAFLAGSFLTADAARRGQRALAERMRRRSIVVGAATGLVVFAGLIPIEHDAPTLWEGLIGRAAPVIALSAIGGAATLVLLWRRRFGLARVTAVVAVAAVMAGWGIGQYPWVLVDQVTIAETAGARATLQGLLVAVGLAGVIVGPALGYLLYLTQTPQWSDQGAEGAERVHWSARMSD
ncbi:cytochrome bd-I ubiquinol oxidase subunit 2 apoprotein [Glycomyces artemisiae]|uniref:Cytochrome bd-I ubiquinol oxidase subunit 2 apoprotein n=2 Tax=Glycomyces artemisiae TaxID=1076443 RepID=A0A2T0UIM7_9ACTN|nr:cytochrome d ubiquinol oxidase subunit II [Glycomyces artemisiae]PRY57795.1 cytochrome bd-I ubiquinol oxidase subunit 2 apoprotein [Glycomyces artemisiae]